MKITTNWKLSLLMCGIAVLCCSQSDAQLVFSVTDLPHNFGEHYRAYVASNIDITPLIGQPGGPHRWDFSQSPATTEGVLRVDVVTPADGGHGAGFPGASYAERETGELDGLQSWNYHRIVTNQGRLFYGSYNPNTEAAAEVIFDSSPIDFPDSVQLGRRWNWSADHHFLLLNVFLVDVNTTVNAHADAYGTLILSGIGEVPALRVIEVRTNTFSLDGTPRGSLGEQVNTNYSWLVRGVGRAAKITLYGNNPLAPVELPFTNTFLRVFEASTVTDRALPSVNDLQIRLHQGLALLSWRQETNLSQYRVERRRDFTASHWQLRAEPTNNSWSESVTNESQMFFRVFVKP